MFEDYGTVPAPQSRSTSVAGSVAIHLGILLIVFQVRSTLARACHAGRRAQSVNRDDLSIETWQIDCASSL